MAIKIKKTLSNNPLFKIQLVKDIMKGEKKHELLIGVILIIYLIFDIPMPKALSKSIDTKIGNVVVVLLALITFVATNTIVGILSLVVAYEIIRRSRKHGHQYNRRYLPSENNKKKYFNNEIPKTLEETIIKSGLPLENKLNDKPSYQPILEDQHSSSLL